MKSLKFIHFAFLFYFTQSLLAQEILEKNMIVGGYVSFEYMKNYDVRSIIFASPFPISSNGDNKYTSYSVSPYFGQQINKHWLLGVNINYSYYKTEYLSSTAGLNDRTRNDINLGIFSRYSFKPDQKFNLFLQPQLVYQISNSTQNSNSIKEKVSATSGELLVDAGVMYNLNGSWRLTAKLGRMYFISGKYIVGKESQSYTQFGTNLYLTSPQFGVEYLF